MDAPGEYVLNTTTGMVFFIPPISSHPDEDGEVVVSTIDGIVALTGGVSHVKFIGLT